MEPKGNANSTYVATIQIVVAARTTDEAGDQIGDLLDGIHAEDAGVIDWAYVKVGQQFLYPSPLFKQPGDYLAEFEAQEQAKAEIEAHLANGIQDFLTVDTL